MNPVFLDQLHVNIHFIFIQTILNSLYTDLFRTVKKMFEELTIPSLTNEI